MTKSKKPRGHPVEHPTPDRMIIQLGAGHMWTCIMFRHHSIVMQIVRQGDNHD